jgi:hypothetical protein
MKKDFEDARIANIYKFYHQRNDCLLTYEALNVSTLTGHPQVLQVSHTQPLNCNVCIPIYIHMVQKSYFLCIFNSTCIRWNAKIAPLSM